MNWLNKLERKIGRYAVPTYYMADRSLYDRLCIRNRIAWYFKLSDTQSLSYFTWTDLETGDMGVYADRVQSDLLTDHGIVLLPAWHGTGTYLGNLPV